MNRKEFLFLFAARYEPIQITNENMDEVIITLTTTIVVVREFEFWVIVILDIFFSLMMTFLSVTVTFASC